MSNDPNDVYEANSDAVYTLDVTSSLTGLTRHTILVYHRHGLIRPVGNPDEEGYQFNDEAIRVLRRIQHLRATYGPNVEGLRLILELMNEVERLKRDLRFRG